MITSRSLRLLLASTTLLCCGSGCVTHALWTRNSFDEWNEPAPSPNLHLFLGPQNKDFLAVYDEYCARHDVTRTRAYWVYENDSHTAKRHRPDFTSTNASQGLTPVPVFLELPAGTNAPDFLYARMLSPGAEFVVYSGNREVSSHSLPTYNDGEGLPTRIALTPVTVTADAIIVGTVLGVYFIVQGGWTGLNHL